MFRSILVPLDGTRFGEQALPLAAELARRCDATLHLAQVITPVIVGDNLAQYAVIESESTEDVSAYLVERVRELGPTPRVQTKVLDGAVTDALEGYASANGVDLVVMATHGRGPFARAWLGSVADELTHDTHLPLLLVRPGDEDQPPFSMIQTVVIGLDGTAHGETILQPALDLAERFGAAVTLVRVITPPAPTGLSLAEYAATTDNVGLYDQMRAAARDYLDRVVAELAARRVPAATQLVEAEHAAKALIAAADDRGLVAVATHGRTGLSRLILGSVADQVVRGAHTAVLVRHAEEPADKRTEPSDPEAETTMNDDEVVAVFTTNDPTLAAIIANELRDEGIECRVDGIQQGGFPGVIPEVAVEVHAADAERARTIIDAHENAKA